MDILTNSGGAVLGGAILRFFEGKFKSASAKIFSFHLPLMNVVFLILPLCWLNTLLTHPPAGQFVRLLLLSCIGSFTLAAIYLHHLRRQISGGRTLGALMVLLWNILALTPLLYSNYRMFLALLSLHFILTILMFLSADMIGKRQARFEIPTLKRILPLLTLYLFLANFWPFKIPTLSIQIVAGFIDLGADPNLFDLLQILEFISAFALIGYLMAELSSRWMESKQFGNYWLFTLLASLAAEIELLRGIHPDFALNLMRLGFGILGGFFGIFVFNMQIMDVQKYYRDRIFSPPEATHPEGEINTVSGDF